MFSVCLVLLVFRKLSVSAVYESTTCLSQKFGFVGDLRCWWLVNYCGLWKPATVGLQMCLWLMFCWF